LKYNRAYPKTKINNGKCGLTMKMKIKCNNIVSKTEELLNLFCGIIANNNIKYDLEAI